MPYTQYADLPGLRVPSRQVYYDAPARKLHIAKGVPAELVAPQISRPRSTPLHHIPPNHRRHASDGERFEEIYAWVADQDFRGQNGKYQDVKRWLADQRMAADAAECRPGSTLGWGGRENVEVLGREHRRRRVDTMLSSYQSRVDATIAMSRQQEAEARRRDGERVKVVAEEMRRIDERIRIKREMERQKLMEERRAQEEYRRERRRTEQATLNQAITDAWERYETRWDKLKMPDFDEALTFRTIPWPLTYIPKTIEDIHPHAITFFLLSPLHSEEQPRKERIRSALLRWHPDRFRRLLDRVEETDRKAVEEGVGVITRCINDLLMREQSFSAYNL